MTEYLPRYRDVYLQTRIHDWDHSYNSVPERSRAPPASQNTRVLDFSVPIHGSMI